MKNEFRNKRLAKIIREEVMPEIQVLFGPEDMYNAYRDCKGDIVEWVNYRENDLTLESLKNYIEAIKGVVDTTRLPGKSERYKFYYSFACDSVIELLGKKVSPKK